MMLHNKTALPVSWQLRGLEGLGDEFLVPEDQGIISSNSSFSLTVDFLSKKPLCIEKTLSLEVGQNYTNIMSNFLYRTEANESKFYPAKKSMKYNIHRYKCACSMFQVSDAVKTLGVTQTATINVTAEAYDIALGISPSRSQYSVQIFKFIWTF